MREITKAIAVIGGLAIAKLAIAASIGLLADEAYFRCWAERPALGYFDQPPLVAWLLVPIDGLGPAPALTRLPAIACGAGAALALLPFATSPVRWALVGCVPLLFALTFAMTPDAPLLLGWALALAGALAGGPWWLLAGFGAGVAFLSKYTGLAVLPLAIAAAGRDDWRSRWPWAGAVVFLAIAAPNVWWNARNGWVAFDFQLHEGLLHAAPPGLFGALAFVGQQLGVITPIAVLAGLWACANSPRDRAWRLLVGTSLPVLALFLIASPFAPSEAYWPAPAWLGLLLLLCRTESLARAADLALGLAAAATLWLAACLAGLVIAPSSITDRFAEGALLVDGVRAWAVPASSEIGARTAPIWTERYQEAAFLRVAGLPAERAASCGRPDELTRRGAEHVGRGLFVRPRREGPLTCLDAGFTIVSGPHDLDGIDARGHLVARWQLFEVKRAGPTP